MRDGINRDVGHLDVPRGINERSHDFEAGYSLGLLGGVRSWVSINISRKQEQALTSKSQMTRSRRNLNDSRPSSVKDSSDEESNGGKSPPLGRGRQNKRSSEQDEVDAQVVDEMDLRS